MSSKTFLLALSVITATVCVAQNINPAQHNVQKHDTTGKSKTVVTTKRDTLPEQKAKANNSKDLELTDLELTDYEELFNELDLLLDSLYTPRSFAVINLGLTRGYFSYSSLSDSSVAIKSNLIYNPSAGYYSKYGLGISGSASLIYSNGSFIAYQYGLTGSYDFLKDKRFLTGVSYSRFFTKDNLAFYTSPLQNEVYGYFTHRKLWFKPSVGVSYGWGSREAYEKRKQQMVIIHKNNSKKKKKVTVTGQTVQTDVTTVEQIADLTTTASVRHDFYFLNVLSKRDYFRLTPQVALVSGTQQFGFNQTTNSFLPGKRVGTGELYTAENVVLENKMEFRPLSLTVFLKTEYVKQKFFLQPQVAFDYYFPASTNKFSTMFSINAGLLF